MEGEEPGEPRNANAMKPGGLFAQGEAVRSSGVGSRVKWISSRYTPSENICSCSAINVWTMAAYLKITYNKRICGQASGVRPTIVNAVVVSKISAKQGIVNTQYVREPQIAELLDSLRERARGNKMHDVVQNAR